MPLFLPNGSLHGGSTTGPDKAGRRSFVAHAACVIGSFCFVLCLYATLDATSASASTFSLVAAVLASSWLASRNNPRYIRPTMVLAVVASLVISAPIAAFGLAQYRRIHAGEQFYNGVSLKVQQIFGYNRFARQASIVVPETNRELRDKILADPFSGIESEMRYPDALTVWHVGGAAVRVEIVNRSTETIRIADIRTDWTPVNVVRGSTFLNSEKGGSSVPPQILYFDLRLDGRPRTEDGSDYFAANNLTVDPGKTDVLILNTFPGPGFQKVRFTAEILSDSRSRSVALFDDNGDLLLADQCSDSMPDGFVRSLNTTGSFVFESQSSHDIRSQLGCG